jgi:hypothetical protein
MHLFSPDYPHLKGIEIINQHAFSAISIFLFALAQKLAATQKDGAFQASSPIKLYGAGSK